MKWRLPISIAFENDLRLDYPADEPDPVIGIIYQQLQHIQKTMSEITDSIKSLKDAATAERAQVKAALDDLKAKLQAAIDGAGGHLTDAEKAAFADAQASIAGIYEPDAPINGSRVAIGFNSSGKEIVGLSLVYVDTPPETAGLLLEKVANPISEAIASTAPASIPVAFDFFLTVDGVNQTPDAKGTDLAPLLFGQEAALVGFLSIVRDQIAELPPA